MILSCAKETISSLHQQPTIIIRTSELYHYKAAIRLEGEELERSFAAALERPDVVILLGVLDGIVTLQVEQIREHGVQNGAGLGSMEDKRLLAGLNELRRVLEELPLGALAPGHPDGRHHLLLPARFRSVDAAAAWGRGRRRVWGKRWGASGKP
jgi:hypothetical protein